MSLYSSVSLHEILRTMRLLYCYFGDAYNIERGAWTNRVPKIVSISVQVVSLAEPRHGLRSAESQALHVSYRATCVVLTGSQSRYKH